MINKLTRVEFRGKLGYIIGESEGAPRLLFESDTVHDNMFHCGNFTELTKTFREKKDNANRYYWVEEYDVELLEAEWTPKFGEVVDSCFGPATFLGVEPVGTVWVAKKGVYTASEMLCAGTIDRISEIKPEPSIGITVKVNGESVPLSEISEETLLKIRENS